jgi:glutamate/tyrosine decarboxylase-like PLP-dependent enzyme
LERQARALDPGTTRRRALLRAVNGLAERFLRRRTSLPGYNAGAGTGLGLLDHPIGEQGHPFADLLALLDREVIQTGAATATGRHMAYIPGGGLYHGALGDFLAAVTNKYSGIFFSGPGAVRMENLVVRWAADLVGYPATAGGHTASGGSLATLAAIAAARDAHGVSGERIARSVVYTTGQAHHALAKALHLAGLGAAPVRQIPMDPDFRMRPDALEATLRDDRAAGLTPWLVAATAGTTDTGAVDPLDALAEIAGRERCWFHVDGAYGGFFLLTEDGRRLMRGIEHSDSIVLDPHKCLFLPYGSGMVMVRDAETLRAAHSHTGSYMQDTGSLTGEPSPADLSPELTRPFRALRMWLPLMALGVRPFRAALEEKLLLARYAHQQLSALGFEVGPAPQLSVVTYRWVPPGADDREADAFNLHLIRDVLHDGRVFLSSTRLNGRVWLRLVVVTHRTHLREVTLAIEVLRELVARRAG